MTRIVFLLTVILLGVLAYLTGTRWLDTHALAVLQDNQWKLQGTGLIGLWPLILTCTATGVAVGIAAIFALRPRPEPDALANQAALEFAATRQALAKERQKFDQERAQAYGALERERAALHQTIQTQLAQVQEETRSLQASNQQLRQRLHAADAQLKGARAKGERLQKRIDRQAQLMSLHEAKP